MTQNNRISRRARGALTMATAAGVLAPLAAVAAPAAAAPAAPKVVCTSAKAGLAAKLTKDITSALRNRRATTAIAFEDPATKTSCFLRKDSKFDSASVVKATVLATLLWDAKKHNRHLTAREAKLAKAMITQSDNASTSALWRQLGVSKVKGFLAAAKMTRTVPGSGGYWGLTQITAGDEQKLLRLLTNRNAVLSDSSRKYALDLMGKVVTSQRWGTSAGAPRAVKVQVKNGWLPRATHGWRVHSIGAFTGPGRNYTMAVLTHDNRTMNDGVATIQAVARAIHNDINPRGLAPSYSPTTAPQEVVPPMPRS
ncbi:serine hydrolase [Streptomyces sp. MST-110588]|uniref:serine hydrolase n=1 Tax=Streptomyces sp. MST-110588 TaxID=2833628 RepID=UPI001F5DE7FD|nr:serine hydrolase [Streptomyces sp. MST-110588]UNO42764.1 serine hydrolase [Streptomyces sp. MST-110588]